jgi:hypothetical protein
VSYETLKGLLIQEDRVYFRTRPAEFARQKVVRFISPLLPLTPSATAAQNKVQAYVAADAEGGDNPAKFDGDCRNCGKHGHMAKDCKKPKKEKGGGGNNKALLIGW